MYRSVHASTRGFVSAQYVKEECDDKHDNENEINKEFDESRGEEKLV